MRKFLKGILTLPFFGLLAGIYPIIFLWAENQIQVKTIVIIPVFLLTILAVSFVLILISLVAKSWAKGSMISTFLFACFFSYGHVYNAIKGKLFFGVEIGYLKLLVIYLILLAAGLFLLLRIKKVSTITIEFLNVLFFILVLVNGVGIAGKQLAVPVDTNKGLAGSQIDDSEKAYPDIYYIIPDAYAREDFLREEYHYDNSDFIRELEARGFYIAECANSNYDGTITSVASSLNFSYFNFYDIPGDDLSEGAVNSTELIHNSRIRKILSDYGYQFVTTRGYSAFNDITDSDIYVNVVQNQKLDNSLQRDRFTKLYLSTTMLRYLFEVYTSNPSEHAYLPYWFELYPDFEYLDTSHFWYEQTRYVFDYLGSLPQRPGAFFVYAHINAPHGPYVFDSNGNFRYIPYVDSDPVYYTDTITYINKRLLELVDQLILQSSPDPIIIIQADHGSHIVSAGYSKHEILNAYYFPNRDFELYETITPVNTFRLVLIHYFDQDMELLPDKIYVKVNDDYEIHDSQCSYP